MKKNISEFYNALKNQFPKIDKLELWDKYDWSLNGNDNVFIMSEIVVEIINWKKQKDINELFEFIEIAFIEFDERTTSLLYSDFLVSIIEIETETKNNRELLKQAMLQITREKYNRLLEFYHEN